MGSGSGKSGALSSTAVPKLVLCGQPQKFWFPWGGTGPRLPCFFKSSWGILRTGRVENCCSGWWKMPLEEVRFKQGTAGVWRPFILTAADGFSRWKFLFSDREGGRSPSGGAPRWAAPPVRNLARLQACPPQHLLRALGIHWDKWFPWELVVPPLASVQLTAPEEEMAKV